MLAVGGSVKRPQTSEQTLIIVKESHFGRKIFRVLTKVGETCACPDENKEPKRDYRCIKEIKIPVRIQTTGYSHILVSDL